MLILGASRKFGIASLLLVCLYLLSAGFFLLYLLLFSLSFLSSLDLEHSSA